MRSQLEEHSRLHLRSEHISYEGHDTRLHRISTIHTVHHAIAKDVTEELCGWFHCTLSYCFELGEDLYSLKETWPQRLHCKWLTDIKPFPSLLFLTQLCSRISVIWFAD